MFIVLLYTFLWKAIKRFHFFFKIQKNLKDFTKKELNLEPLILYSCRLYDCFAIFIRRLKQSLRLDVDCLAIFICRLKRSPRL